MSNKWKPLNNIWEDYSSKLDSVNDAELADDLVWPQELFVADSEKDDVKTFVGERIEEMVLEANKGHGINLQWVGGFIFKSLVSGMLWEKERIGR